jgi:hypothetical protein|tara:strand:+ start:2117 stop:2383 length:267 start_codon:yes stop_codon:yes gene_type:complete
MKTKILEIITIMLFCSCQTNQEGIDYINNGNRTYDVAMINGHGYFVPVHTPNILPPNPPPPFTPTGEPNFIPYRNGIKLTSLNNKSNK